MPNTPYFHGEQIRFTILAHAQVDVGVSPTGLPSIPTGDLRKEIKRTVIRAVDGDIFWTGDGTTPTVDSFPAKQDEVLVYDGNILENFSMISAAGTVDVRIIYMA